MQEVLVIKVGPCFLRHAEEFQHPGPTVRLHDELLLPSEGQVALLGGTGKSTGCGN